MRFLPLLASVVLVLEAGGAIAFLVGGSYLLGLLLAVGVVLTVTAVFWARRMVKRAAARNPAPYVVRETTHW